jgi:phospholipid/cholesterol/gamma-HCH transport system substrate-binding protein
MGDRFPLVKFVVFAVVCVLFTLWLVQVIGNFPLNPFAGRTMYTAEFEDVTGLLVNDKVKIAGVDVGKVTGIEYLEGGGATVTFKVAEDLRVPADTAAEVRWRDVFGLRYLYLVPGGGPAVEKGHTFPREQTSNPANLADLLAELTPFIEALDADAQNAVLESLTDAFVGREDEVRSLLTDGTELLQALASRDEEIGSLLTNSATLFEAYAKREQQLRSLLDTFADVATAIAERNDDLDAAIVELANAQEQLARLLEDNDSDIRGALDEAEHITDVLSTNHDNLAYILQTGAAAVVNYHRTSAFGQFFNIHAVGASINYNTLLAHRDAALPVRSYPIESEESTTRDSSSGAAMASAFSPTAATVDD